MSKINDIVAIVNDNIVSSSDCINVRALGISEVIIRDGKRFPVIVERGDIENIFFDDSFQCELYHKQNNESSTIDYSQGFGNSNLIDKTFDNSIILYCRNKPNEYINEIIDKAFGIFITQAQRSILGLNFVAIQLKSISTDKQSIYNSEFGELRYKLNANDVLIKIDYSIKYSVQNTCYTPSLNC